MNEQLLCCTLDPVEHCSKCGYDLCKTHCFQFTVNRKPWKTRWMCEECVKEHKEQLMGETGYAVPYAHAYRKYVI